MKSKPSYTDLYLVFYSAVAGGALFVIGVMVGVDTGISVAAVSASSAGAEIIDITKYFLDKAA